MCNSVIYKFDFYDYHKFGKNVNYTSAKRIRVKLLDEAAVKEFSEFTFTERFLSSKGYAMKRGTNSIGINNQSSLEYRKNAFHAPVLGALL